MIAILEARRVHSRHADFAAAVAFAQATFRIAYFEADADFENCADFLTDDGRVFAIEPA